MRDILKEQAKDDSNGDATKGGHDMEGVAQDTWKLVRLDLFYLSRNLKFQRVIGTVLNGYRVK